MARGKCWIYKRATLMIPGLPASIIDYSDGIDAFDCDNVVINPDEYPVYMWNLPTGDVIPIPMNIPRYEVESIVRTGEIPTNDGVIVYEFIFGKYRCYSAYYLKQFVDSIPIIIAVMVAMKLYERRSRA